MNSDRHKDMAAAFKQDSDTSPLGAKPSWPRKQIHLPQKLTVTQLAEISGLKRFQIIARLMDLGIFTNVDYVMDFATAEKAIRYYNMTAELQKE